MVPSLVVSVKCIGLVSARNIYYIVYDMEWTRSRFPVTALFLPT